MSNPHPQSGQPSQRLTKGSWADMAGTRVRKSEKSNKNVLEVAIESEQDSETLSSEMMEELFRKLDIKIAYQNSPGSFFLQTKKIVH